jgi:pimeloyl-ACP methyl ester carboxylesterase
MSTSPKPFKLHVGDEVLADLKERLARVRWPDEVPGNAWQYGTNLAYLKSLVEYWRDGYDWRKHEEEINAFDQYKVKIAGIDLHYIRAEGKGPKPLPLLLSHGWPGSVHEFHKIIPMLTDPARFGGNPEDAFTVIAPSLPGYVFSFTPNQQRFSVEQIADAFAELMTDVLGYKRFAAQGGDWGGFVTSRLGYAYPDRLYGIHVNLLSLRRDSPMPENPTPEEKLYFEQRAYWMKEEVGYTGSRGPSRRRWPTP